MRLQYKHTPIDIEEILQGQYDTAGNDPEKDYRHLPVRGITRLPEKSQRIADYLTTQIHFYAPGECGSTLENTNWREFDNYIAARRIVEDARNG